MKPVQDTKFVLTLVDHGLEDLYYMILDNRILYSYELSDIEQALRVKLDAWLEVDVLSVYTELVLVMAVSDTSAGAYKSRVEFTRMYLEYILDRISDNKERESHEN